MEFTGFSPETFDFLWGIRMNNNREWFEAHKQDYLETLYRPMQALGEALYVPFRGVPGMRCKVSRIYRDTRMPQPNGPYKDGLWVSLRQDAFDWGEHPCLYFDLHPEGAEYGFVIWRPKPARMARFREELAANPDRFLTLAEKAERESGMTLTGERYKRAKPCADARAARFMSSKNLMCSMEIAPGPLLFDGAALLDTVQPALQALLPLYEYFFALEGMGE